MFLPISICGGAEDTRTRTFALRRAGIAKNPSKAGGKAEPGH